MHQDYEVPEGEKDNVPEESILKGMIACKMHYAGYHALKITGFLSDFGGVKKTSYDFMKTGRHTLLFKPKTESIEYKITIEPVIKE